jgi:hypothetical protein
MSPLTIKDLRLAIKDLDGNLPVYLSRDPEGNGFETLYEVSPCDFDTQDRYPIHPDDLADYAGDPKVIKVVVLWP